MTIYDITRTISVALKVWPGDAQYRVNAVLKMNEGAAVNLTTLTLSAHTGTHADAYFHYEADGDHPAPCRSTSISGGTGHYRFQT